MALSLHETQVVRTGEGAAQLLQVRAAGDDHAVREREEQVHPDGGVDGREDQVRVDEEARPGVVPGAASARLTRPRQQAWAPSRCCSGAARLCIMQSAHKQHHYRQPTRIFLHIVHAVCARRGIRAYTAGVPSAYSHAGTESSDWGCAPCHEAHEVELGAEAVYVPRETLLPVAARHLQCTQPQSVSLSTITADRAPLGCSSWHTQAAKLAK